MFLIDTSRNGQPVYNALVNQSLDAYLINDLHLEGHGLIFYINDPAVIIGRYQNAYAEVNLNYMKEHQIQLVRRTSGGGAVYHDRGNVIFENIVVGDTSGFRDFQWVGAPIVDALHDLGLRMPRSGAATTWLSTVRSSPAWRWSKRAMLTQPGGP